MIKNKNVNHYYKTTLALLKMPIKTIKNLEKFYLVVNNLASEIASDKDIFSIDNQRQLNKNLKLRKAITDVLGFGIAIRNSKIFPKEKTKKINLNPYIKNSKMETEIKKEEIKAKEQITKHIEIKRKLKYY